jgi:hypothetical protein
VVLGHLCRDLQWDTYGSRRSRGQVRTLIRVHPAEEQREPALTASYRKAFEVETVVNHAGDIDAFRRGGLVMGNGDYRHPTAHGLVQRAQFAQKRTVVGGYDGQLREPVGVNRPGQGVIVHDVELARRFIGRQDVSQLGCRARRAHPTRRWEDPFPPDWTAAVARREEKDFVAGLE